ncbi:MULTISPECIES: hypothetical protein [Streptomyces]|uniref:hypothetical protein n=1 Tax=Streptomyces TaxID=1883 RepID=UPI001F227D77|nr:hypothetical protein [Streptomyces sp. CB01201]
MNTEIDNVNLDWIPLSGIRLGKAGVQFDAVRIDGDAGRCVADVMEELTGGDPGPIVADALGCRAVYFLVPPRSTSHRSWPAVAIPFNSGPNRVSYVPVPALSGHTWPLSWRCPPSGPDRFVHTPLLCAVVSQPRYCG